MTVQCIDCQHFSLRDAGQMARQGYGHCDLQKSKSSFESADFERQCREHRHVDRQTSISRRGWLEGERQKFAREVLGA